MRKSVQNLEVISNTRLNSDHHLLKLKSSQKLEEINPGQFVNVLVDHTLSVFLRRPYSVHAVDYEHGTFDILVKALGEGSKSLSQKQAGEQLSVIFPLGNGFTLPSSGEKVLLVGGGCGVARSFTLPRQYMSDQT